VGGIWNLIGRSLMTVVAATLVTATSATPVLGAASSGWRGVYLSHAGPANLLLGVAAPTRNDAWAVGEYEQQTGPIIMHWNGQRWRPVDVPGVGPGFEPSSVYATSPSNVWIFGSVWWSGADEALHFNGETWHTSQFLINTGGTNETAVLGSHGVWVISAGTCLPPCSTPAYFWNGHGWGPSKVGHDLWGIAAGGNHLFAIAVTAFRLADQTFVPVLYERAHASWQRLAVVPQRLSDPLLTGSSTNDVWIWGHLTGRANPAVLYHWNGTSLQQVPVPAGLLTTDVLTADGRGGVWAGPYAHWTGTKWISLRADAKRLGASVTALAPIAGTGSTWIVGGLPWHNRDESFVGVNGKTP
jgi:hypothetical protein